MQLSLVLLLSLLFNSNSIYVIYLRKCNYNDEYMISRLQYQYDIEHYPIYCNSNTNKFDLNNIEHMRINLEQDWGICEYDYKYEYINNYNKHNKLIEDIWYNYGSCTNMTMFEYYNKTLELFYWYKHKFYDCVYNNFECKHIFNKLI